MISIYKIYKFWKRIFKTKAKISYRYFGENVVLGENCQFLNSDKISIGNDVYIGPDAWFHAGGEITINNGSIIGPRCKIYTMNHNYRSTKAIPYDDGIIVKSVIIGENVWIGGDVIILPGVEIGEGCVVAAGSVITKKWPSFKILGGNPCKVVGERDVEEYLKLKRENKIYLKLKSEGKMNSYIIQSYTND